MRRRRVRWGVVGLGVGNHHALALLNDQEAELIGVCDAQRSVLEEATKNYRDVPRFANLEEMLDVVDLDAVVIASHDWDHADAIALCLKRGMHVFAEKPLGLNHRDYRILERALNCDSRVRMTTNTLLRRSPRFVWLKDEIESGRLGEIAHIQADYLYGRLRKLTHGWRGTNPEYSVTLGGAVHMVDLMLWLVGERPISVTAVGNNVSVRGSTSDLGAVGFAGDSFRVGLLSFPSGLTASVSANFGSVGPHFHRLDVYGTRATFMNLPTAAQSGQTIPGSTGLLLKGPDPGTSRVVDVPYPAVPKSALLAEFNMALLGQGPPPISEQEAMDAFAVCLALDESVRSAGPVSITYGRVSPRH